jgi:predicted ATPase
MQIFKLEIKNYKSIQNLEINSPGNFLVFVGANASGKSNIVESLEFASSVLRLQAEAVSLFGGFNEIKNFNTQDNSIYFKILALDNYLELKFTKQEDLDYYTIVPKYDAYFSQFRDKFSRIFPSTRQDAKIRINDDSRLSLDCNNLGKVLGRLLNIKEKHEEIVEILQTLIPGFQDIEVRKSNITQEDKLYVYEEHTEQPFTDKLISDGTYNILSLITAVLQSDEPQFLCLEEPENGLNPKVIKELVHFFREKCKLYGHFIWLTTHSQSLVSALLQSEIIIVNKLEGNTKVRQINNIDLHGLPIDEAWLSNVFGGGIPW